MGAEASGHACGRPSRTKASPMTFRGFMATHLSANSCHSLANSWGRQPQPPERVTARHPALFMSNMICFWLPTAQPVKSLWRSCRVRSPAPPPPSFGLRVDCAMPHTHCFGCCCVCVLFRSASAWAARVQPEARRPRQAEASCCGGGPRGFLGSHLRRRRKVHVGGKPFLRCCCHCALPLCACAPSNPCD